MEKYTAQNPEDIVPIVAKYGVCIYENVLTPEECALGFSQAWDFFEELHPALKRDDSSTWKHIHDLRPLHGMLFQHWGIGHAQYIWNIRSNPKVINIFKVIWDCILKNKYPDRNEVINKLKVSFDGASFGVPPEDTNKGWQGKDWFHIDQRFNDSILSKLNSLEENSLEEDDSVYSNMQCIQSWVTTEDVGPDDATLSILEGSNALHTKVGQSIYEVTKDKKIFKSDWYKFDQDELNVYYRDCPRINIECKAGSMVFWDSRTVHCGRGPIRKRKEKRFRNVIYLCYMPSFMITDKMLAKRRKTYEDLRATSHWPDKVKLFSLMPRMYSKDYITPELKNYKKIKPILSPEAIELI